MNKKELVKAIAGDNSLAVTEEIVDKVFNTIEDKLSSGEQVSVHKFGTFCTSLLSGRSGTIPGSDKTYTTQAKMVPKFKASKNLKESVAGLNNG